ncbi:MAG TPA: tetratricopeptide repeat protein [Kofleriaceae bacterium]|nr:tetratricopeptide repeat protein [Kofleriaceae bacterium]
MARFRALLFAALLLPLGGWEPLWRMDPDVAEGNKAYQEKRYDDAIEAYERARESGVDAAGLDYDLGTAKIGKADALADAEKAKKEGLYGDAMDHLAKAAKGGKPQLQGKAHFNRGNVLMKQKKLEAAIEAYKDALRADSTMESARVNLELALRQREREKQQQQQQQGQGQGQQGQGQGQQGQQQQPQGGGDGQQQQQQGQGQGQQQQQGQGQQGQGQGQQGQQQGQQGQGGQGDPQGQQGNQGGSTAGQTPQPQWPRDDTEYDTPDKPDADKFNDLEAMSRQQRRDQVRNRRSSGSSRYDYDKDW